MIDGTRFAVFLSAAAILALTAGPGILYVVGRTLHGGRREGVLSALGTLVGGSVHVLAAGLGLSAILMTSATAFQVVRYAGAAYLIYLGISMIRKRRVSGSTQTVGQSSQQNFLQGIATEVLNPKTALFFLSFIPQFVSPAKGHLILQFQILGAISVVLNTTVDLVVVGFSGGLAQRLARNSKLIESIADAEGWTAPDPIEIRSDTDFRAELGQRSQFKSFWKVEPRRQYTGHFKRRAVERNRLSHLPK